MNLDLAGLFTAFFKKKDSSANDKSEDNYFAHRKPHPFRSVCYAPFKSLYFGHEGRVIACCKNRDYVLGNFPTQSIKEIWQGEKANALREALKRDSFEHGCESCEVRILSKNYNGLLAATYDVQPLDPDGYPTDLQFELTNTCNLECIMCSGDFSSLIRTKREKRPPLSQPYDHTFVEQLREFIPHLYSASFYGGEPFLIDTYYQIWDEIARINPAVNIFIQTNGTVLNNRLKDLLEISRFHISVSVDSIDETNYPKIRINGDWATTKQNIDWFADYCRRKKTDFNISICPLQQNWHELVNIVEFANSYQATAVIHQLLSPRQVAIGSLPKTELKNIHTAIAKRLETYNDQTELAKRNLLVLKDYLKDLEYKIANYTPRVFNDINTLPEIYPMIEKRLLADSLGYDREGIMDKLKEALKGMETDPLTIKKFREVNLDSATIWRNMLSTIHSVDPAHLRNIIIQQM